MRTDARIHRLALAVLVASACFALATLVAPLTGRERSTSASAGGAPAGGCEWAIVGTPNVDVYNAFHAVTALSADDIWAAGASGPDVAGQHTLIAHWDGSAWSIVPSPDAGPNMNNITSIDAVAPDDIWALGSYNDGQIGGTTDTMALHWDGSTWSVVSTPNAGTYRNELYGVSALSTNDVWAVGYVWHSPSVYNTLILHWNGTSWNIVPGANPAAVNNLMAVDALSPSYIWAVGQYLGPDGNYRTLIERWDGSAWSVMPSPSFTSTNNYLTSVSVVSANDAWAAGYTCLGNCFGTNYLQPLALHWDGSAWSIVPLPPLWGEDAYLNAVLATSAGDVWVAGGYSLNNEGFALMMHWDGSAWTTVPSPRPNLWTPAVNGLVAPSPGDVWAVGEFHYPGNPVFRTLAERYVCPSGTPTATPATPAPTATATRTAAPVPSSTPAPTGTVVPPTATLGQPTATPSTTACPLTFSDVPSGSAFYSFVRCLACRGIVSGYADGTFRPNNPVTRGQLAKIVSESANFDDQIPPDQQTFSDVAYGSTYWEWVERLANREVMAGYACGGTGEPCDSENRPYFRPGSGATRGQLTKIVSNAAGFDDAIPPTQYTFTDVPPTHTFWLFVERLLLNRPNVMAGYPCGAGEPCDPQNRPYFRPNNPLTRGQTSKIVANTFFPGCALPGR